jgi:Sec7-like guanine-nucleotide exchange factor
MVDDTIELAPTPDTSYTLQLTYYGKIDALSATNTSNFVSVSHPDVYLYGALKHASIYLMEDERIPMFTQQFEKALEEMRLAQEKSAFGKGSLQQRSRTYGKRQKRNYYYGN